VCVRVYVCVYVNLACARMHVRASASTSRPAHTHGLVQHVCVWSARPSSPFLALLQLLSQVLEMLASTPPDVSRSCLRTLACAQTLTPHPALSWLQVFEWLMCSDPEQDSHRFMDAIQAALDAGKCARKQRAECTRQLCKGAVRVQGSSVQSAHGNCARVRCGCKVAECRAPLI